MDFNEFGYSLICGDSRSELEKLPDGIVDCCVTSPPYYNLRDYGIDGQIGSEQTPGDYIQSLVDVFHEVKRVLKDDGTLWVNIGDSYWNANPDDGRAGELAFGSIKQKDKIGIPWMLAFALRNDGWYLRQDIIWSKSNPQPESVRDRCVCSHEYIFMFSKSQKYHYDYEAVQEPAGFDIEKTSLSRKDGENDIFGGDVLINELAGDGSRCELKRAIRMGGRKYGDSDDPHYATRSGKAWMPKVKEIDGIPTLIRNKRDVWTLATTKSCDVAHFATYPEKLVEPCILAGCRENGIMLDPFNGSGTTGAVALKLGRKYIGVELNPEYIGLTESRLMNDPGIMQDRLF